MEQDVFGRLIASPSSGMFISQLMISQGTPPLLAKMGSGKGLWLDSGPWGWREIGSESSGNSVSVLRRHRKRGPFLSPDVVMSRYDARNRHGHLMREPEWGQTANTEDDEVKKTKDPGSWQPCWARLQPTSNQQDASLLGEKRSSRQSSLFALEFSVICSGNHLISYQTAKMTVLENL